MKLLYIVGAPGSGKTTALRSALQLLDWPTPTQIEKPIPHLNYTDSRIQLGRDRGGGFSGTDALSMGINPKAIQYLQTAPAEIIVAEGDRLANTPFFTAAKQTTDFTIIHLDTPPAIARERARLRALRLNTPQQSESWWKGRYTKIDNLLQGRPHVLIHGDNSPDRVATQIAEIIQERSMR